MESWLKNNILTLVFGAGTLVEAISALELTLNPFTGAGTPGPFVELVVGLFNWLIPLAPFLLVSFLYYPIVKLGILWGVKHSKSIKRLTEELTSLRRIGGNNAQVTQNKTIRLLARPRVILIVSVIVSALLSYFPYRPDVNPRQIPVGIDASVYIREINSKMLQQPFSTAAAYAFGIAWGGSRPLFLLAVYFTAQLANVSSGVVIKFLPVIFAPLLILSSYGFLALGTRSKELASLTALLTTFSPVVTVGIWAGYYANWLALIETFAFLGILLSHLRHAATSKFALSIGLSVALLLTHLWTWIVVIPVSFVFCFSLRKEIGSRFLLKVGGSILLVDMFAEYLKSVLVASYSEVATVELVAGQISYPFPSIISFLPNVAYGLIQTYDALLANSLLLVLALVSMISLRYGDGFERLMLIWVVLTALAFPFFDGLLQTRLVYNLPITIIASLGLRRIILLTPIRNIDKYLILSLVILFNANYALLAVAISPII